MPVMNPVLLSDGATSICSSTLSGGLGANSLATSGLNVDVSVCYVSIRKALPMILIV